MIHTGAYLRLLRPQEYVKNSFVLLPVFFGGGITDPDRVAEALLASAVFCLAASAVYVMNDVFDRNEDRNNPVKRERPIASGEVGRHAAALNRLDPLAQPLRERMGHTRLEIASGLVVGVIVGLAVAAI